MKFRLFTPDEKEKIESILKIDPDISFRQLSEKLNRASSSLFAEIKRGGGRANYSAKKSIEISLNNKLNSVRIHKAKATKARLSNIEMQIEIILEEIQALKNG